MTSKWSYIPFFPGEPTNDPKEPPVPPDYAYLTSLTPQRVAVLVNIYEGQAQIFLGLPKDSAEQVANAYADAYPGSSLGEARDSSPFFYSAIEEVRHVLFRRIQHNAMPVRILMRSERGGHNAWWSDPLPEGQSIRFRDVSSHLYEGIPALAKAAPKARICLEFIYERVGAMREERTPRSLLFGTPFKDRIRNRASGMEWTASNGWEMKTMPFSSSSNNPRGMAVQRPDPPPVLRHFRDIFTRREASRNFYRCEPHAAVITRIGDTMSLNVVMDFLRTWARQARYLGLDGVDYDLWTPKVLQPSLWLRFRNAFSRKDLLKKWAEDMDLAEAECSFYPYGNVPPYMQDITLPEALVIQPLPYEKHHRCLSYQAGHTGAARGHT